MEVDLPKRRDPMLNDVRSIALTYVMHVGANNINSICRWRLLPLKGSKKQTMQTVLATNPVRGVCMHLYIQRLRLPPGQVWKDLDPHRLEQWMIPLSQHPLGVGTRAQSSPKCDLHAQVSWIYRLPSRPLSTINLFPARTCNHCQGLHLMVEIQETLDPNLSQLWLRHLQVQLPSTSREIRSKQHHRPRLRRLRQQNMYHMILIWKTYNLRGLCMLLYQLRLQGMCIIERMPMNSLLHVRGVRMFRKQ
jgi:hypothetical protein